MHQTKHWFNKHTLKSERTAVALFFAGVAFMLATSLNAASPRVIITPVPGFAITWDGNNGGFSGSAPSNNIALASNGTVPFTSSDLGPLQIGRAHV